MNPSPFSACSAEGGGTPDSFAPLTDWQESLVEAIQQRDATRALQLAERCVHRYGMHTLECVMERAQGDGGDAQSVRSWLLPLLSQPSVAPPPPSLPTPSQPPASVGLDEAFAPLEVAFPPLTSSLEPPDPPDVPLDPGLTPGPFSDSLPASLFPSRGLVFSENPPLEETFLNEEMEEREAAPVPIFEVDGSSSSPLPSSRRSRKQERRAQSSPAPISPALEPWLVWLPGAFESRSRS